MPSVIAAVAGAVVANAVPGIAGAILGAVVSGAVGMLFRKDPDVPSFDDLRQRGLRTNVSNPVEPIQLVYGETRVGGARVMLEFTGAENRYLHTAICWGEGEIDAVSTIYLNDVEHTEARFVGLIDFGDGLSAHLGTDTQPADSVAIGRLSNWTADHQGKGVAYTYIRLDYDAQAFPQIPTFTADIRGKKVYQVRTGVVAWSNNPADCIYDYLINTRYGRGIPSAEIDLVSFQLAANACDALITTGDGDIKKYTCDGVVDINKDTLVNLRELLTCCRGMLVYSGGLYKLIVDGVQASSFTFDESNITGAWSVTPDNKQNRFNKIRAKFVDANRTYQPNLAIVDDAGYLAADNSTELLSDIDLPFTQNMQRARYIAGLELEQSRFNIVVQFSAKLAGLRAEVGDVVTINHDVPGWTNETFRVLGMELNSQDEIKITARQYANIYAPGTLPAEPIPPTITLPPPPTIEDSLNINVEKATEWLYSFEDGVTGWVELGSSTVSTDSDARVGNLAGLFTNDGDAGVDAYIGLDPNFWYTATAPGRQVRVQFWYKQPATDGSISARVTMHNGVDSASIDIVPTSSWQSAGFVFTPTVQGTVLRIEVTADRNGTNHDLLIDNLAAWVVSDKIDVNNIDQWIANAAIGNAHIGNAAIDSAKIQDAAVGTLQIAGSAVTVKDVNTRTRFYIYAPSSPNGTLHTIPGLSAVINPQGANVFFQFHLQPDGAESYLQGGNILACVAVVLRNGVRVGPYVGLIGYPTFELSTEQVGANLQTAVSNFWFEDAPGPGTHTYTVQLMNCTSAGFFNFGIGFASIAVQSSKR